jgi:glycosyltransferase involved in cell wall biosynthesis
MQTLEPLTKGRKTRAAVLVKLLPSKLGSMEDWLTQFTARLADTFDVAVATYGPCHPVVRQRFEQSGVQWHDLADIERSFSSARTWFKDHADIVHFSLFAPRSLAVVAAASVGSLRVAFQDCHSSATGVQHQSLPSRLLDRVTFARTERIVAVSHFVSRRIQARFGVSSERVQVVYNGVDVERFQHRVASSVARHTICVAALIPDKGLDVLIRAFAQPALAGEHLILCGDGVERVALEALATSEGIADRVEFLGLRDDVHRLVSEAALFVHPAVWGEAFGLTIAEAMAAGRPVVGCHVGAVPELIEDGVTGLLVPPADPPAMAAAIARLLHEPELRDAMGSAARQRVERQFSMQVWVDTHVCIVADLARAP